MDLARRDAHDMEALPSTLTGRGILTEPYYRLLNQNVIGIFHLSYRCSFCLIAGLDYSRLTEVGIFFRIPSEWRVVVPDFISKREKRSLHYRNDIVRFCHQRLHKLRHVGVL